LLGKEVEVEEDEDGSSSYESSFIDDSDSSSSGSEDSLSGDDRYIVKRGKGLPIKPAPPKLALQPLFKGAGVLPVKLGKKQCKNCLEASEDLFKCGKDTEHLKCTNCDKLFPQRAEYSQECFCCCRYFCNLYWREECEKEGAIENPLLRIIDHRFQPHPALEEDYEAKLEVALKKERRQI
jgi:hypothetical protein